MKKYKLIKEYPGPPIGKIEKILIDLINTREDAS